MDHLVRQPYPPVTYEVMALDPQDLQVGMKETVGAPHHPGHFRYSMRVAQVLVGTQLQWQSDAFGMVAFDGLHHAGSLGGIQVDSLSLRHGDGTGIRAAYHDDRYADLVQPGNIGDSRDAHDRQQSTHALQCLLGSNQTMRAATERLSGRRWKAAGKFRPSAHAPSICGGA